MLIKKLVLLIALIIPSLVWASNPDISQCRSFEITGGKQRVLRNNWQLDGFLWKPRAEHYNGLAIVVLPRGVTKKVRYGNAVGRPFWRVVPFRSVGDAGDAFADYQNNGRVINRKRGPVIVEVRGDTLRRFLIQCPQLRSDGLNKSRLET